MKILYIISQKRSGSTLIENLLGQHKQVISVGEFRMLKGHYLKEGPGELWNWKCNCGVEIKDCKFWSKYYKPMGNTPPETALQYELGMWSWLLIFFTGIKRIIKNTQTKGSDIAAYTKKVYRQIENDYPGTVIVDSSKDALQGYFLAELTNDVVILYLKRQLRATVSSKLKRLKKKERSVNLYKLMISSFLLEIFNRMLIKQIDNKRVISFTYENFISEKDGYYKVLLNKLELTPCKIPEYFQPYPSHSIGGTPGRFEKRQVIYDNSWKKFYQNKPVANLLGWFLEKLIN